ncbi:MAG: Sec-independent protein translocase subunit TatA [Kineosporiaceae bacterium]|nr:Sec-independent protein translocase subunit TatA [Kineosporiaceae bacterium]
MIGRIFDSPAQLLIIVLILVLLFGAKRLPDAARGLGRSLRILKAEVKDMKDDEPTATRSTPEAVEGRPVPRTPAEPETGDRAPSDRRYDA